jgi:hypothetical protein
MSVLDGYREEEYGGPSIKAGEYRLKIIKAEEKVFRSGNEGVKIELINKEGNAFFYNIVKNEFFNLNLTRFYDCFNIRRGNKSLAEWAGHYGWVYLDKGSPDYEGRAYMEIKRLIVKKDGAPPDPAAGPLALKRRQAIADIASIITQADPDMLPYFSEDEKSRVNALIEYNGPNEQGVKLLEKEKNELARILQERRASFKPVPGFEDKPEREFKNDIPAW